MANSAHPDHPDTEAGQLDLFREFQLGTSHLSRSVPQIDLLPFFLISRRNELDPNTRVADIPTRKHEFVSGQEKISFEVNPAHLAAKSSDEPARVIFAGEREQLVALAVRHLAVRGEATLGIKPTVTKGNGKKGEKRREVTLVTVAFNVRQIRAELAETNHTFSHAEIMEALDILSRSIATHTRQQDNEEPIAETFSYYADHARQGDKRLVILNLYESQLILSGAYRAFRYDRLMALDDPISRWILQFLHAEFRNVPRPSADKRIPFVITLQDLIDRGVVDAARETRKAIKRVRDALNLLGETGHLDARRDDRNGRTSTPLLDPGYEEILHQASTGGRRRIVGATWRIFPSAQDANEIIDGNAEAKLRKPQFAHFGPTQRLAATSEARQKLLEHPKDRPRKRAAPAPPNQELEI